MYIIEYDHDQYFLLRNVYEYEPSTIAKMDAAGEKIAAAMKVRILIYTLQLYCIWYSPLAVIYFFGSSNHNRAGERHSQS